MICARYSVVFQQALRFWGPGQPPWADGAPLGGAHAGLEAAHELGAHGAAVGATLPQHAHAHHRSGIHRHLSPGGGGRGRPSHVEQYTARHASIGVLTCSHVLVSTWHASIGALTCSHVLVSTWHASIGVLTCSHVLVSTCTQTVPYATELSN